MIKIQSISFQYDGAEAGSLHDVSLTIPDGQCVLLCGESGCGKTTITRLINGLIPHFYEGELTGTVTVGTLDVTKAELYETARLVGSVFQNPRSQFFCVDTTSEIAFGCENMGLPEQEIRQRMAQTVRELNAEALLDRDIFQLSGGEKQKVACASVAALHPEVFVLDEPTSNLDVDAIEDLKKTLRFWKSQRKTIVIAEHRLYWLRELCDRVIYLQDGQIALDTSMDEFRRFSEERLSQMGLRTLSMEIPYLPAFVPSSSRTLELRSFTFSYEKQDAIHIPELSLPLGGIIAVIGKNGAGKSTFSRCLCGLERKFRGSVTMDGMTLRRKDLLKTCYMVMQDVNHQLFCESVEEEVQLGMEEENAQDVPEILKILDLDGLTQRHPMSLSGGQKQRVAVASAILAEKSVLVFDEPTSGLDYQHMQQTAQLISSLRGRKTVFIVTHDPELIVRCCTHILHLESGRMVESYPCDQAHRENLRAFFLKDSKKQEVQNKYA